MKISPLQNHVAHIIYFRKSIKHLESASVYKSVHYCSWDHKNQRNYIVRANRNHWAILYNYFTSHQALENCSIVKAEWGQRSTSARQKEHDFFCSARCSCSTYVFSIATSWEHKAKGKKEKCTCPWCAFPSVSRVRLFRKNNKAIIQVRQRSPLREGAVKRKLCVTIFIVQTAFERCWCTFDGRAAETILSR